MFQWEHDRYTVLLMGDVWTCRDLERRVVAPMMFWWLQAHDGRLACAAFQHCWYCGYRPMPAQPALCFDHIFPAHYATTPLVPCCLPCNRRKGHRTPNEVRGQSHLDGYWFERGIFARSPLGYTLCENFRGFRAMLARFLIGISPIYKYDNGEERKHG